MGKVDKADGTYIRARPEGDTFFLPIEPAVWREIAREEGPVEAGGPSFAWVAYERRAGSRTVIGHG